MKCTIHITSLSKTVRVTVYRGERKTAQRFTQNIEEALKFAISRGNRETDLFLNGYKVVPHAWVAW